MRRRSVGSAASCQGALWRTLPAPPWASSFPSGQLVPPSLYPLAGLGFLSASGLGCVNVSIPVPLLPADFGPSQWPDESPCQPVSPYVAGRELAQTLGVACNLGLRSRGPVGARPGAPPVPTPGVWAGAGGSMALCSCARASGFLPLPAVLTQTPGTVLSVFYGCWENNLTGG